MGKELYISKDNEGRRVDRVIRTLWPHVPLGAIMKALRKGEVRLDAKKVSADTRLEEGQFLQVPWDDNNSDSVNKTKENKKKYPPLATIYKDNYLWIVNKPAGLLTQPDKKGGDSLITRALLELEWERTDFKPSTVQRLDRNTSGIIIIAMSGTAQRHLSELIRERKIKKIYRAVVSGVPESQGEINFPLQKDAESNTVKIDKNGQSALSVYKKLSSREKNSSVEIDLVTGRPHQARVHMSAIGHPLLGDRKYGNGFGAKRPLLHAYSLTFPQDEMLPQNISGKTFVASIPTDMEIFFNTK
ncbi:MAG: RluA family pseudouridine synthase [Synergistaceae bacterium]